MKTTSTIKIGWGRLALFVTALALALGESELRAADEPPELINYQGYLEDGDGDPLGTKEDNTGQLVSNPTNYKVQFQMYDQQIGGNSKWVETQIVTVDNGYFNVYLGESERITGAHFTGTLANQRFMGITVDLDGLGGFDESEIAPRLRLLSTPYAMLAKRAVTADLALNAQTAVTADRAVTADNLSVAGQSSTLTVTAAGAVANGTLNVTGATTLKNTTVDGTLDVTGAVTADEFVGHGTIPVGGIIMWSNLDGKAEPDGWAICNGQTKNQIVTPNLSGRFIVGIGTTAKTGATTYALGPSNVGKEKVALTEAQLPDHTHSGITNIDGAHRHEGNDYWSVTSWVDDNYGSKRTVIATDHSNYNGIQSRNSQHQHSFTTSANPGVFKGEAHENRPPYYALAYIMRVQ